MDFGVRVAFFWGAAPREVEADDSGTIKFLVLFFGAIDAEVRKALGVGELMAGEELVVELGGAGG